MQFINWGNNYGIKKQLFNRALKSGLSLIVFCFLIYKGAFFLIDIYVPTQFDFLLNHQLKDAAMATDMLLCFLIYLILLVQFIKKKFNHVDYLIECIRKMKNEVFDDSVRLARDDEFSHLALHLDEFRIQLAQNKYKNKRQAEKQANLLTSISHDLRTPLTSLIGYLEILSDNRLDKTYKNKTYIDLCLRRAQQLQHLVNTAFEHFYLTDKKLHRVELLRCHSIKGLFEILYDRVQLLKQYGFFYKVITPDYRYAIVYDTRLMERLFDNVFTNVIRYGQQMSEVKIESRVEAEGLLIVISNSIDRKRKPNQSTGIGIKNCHKIMKLHNGHFSAFVEGIKFRVTIYLPINNHNLQQ